MTPRSWVMKISAVPVRRAEVEQQIDDLRLDRDVERRGRLVGDQDLRLAGQGDGDHRALAHAARKLVRIFVDPARRQRDADLGQCVDRALARFLLAHATMGAQRLGDLLADGEHRIERAHRLLEDHADLPAAHLTHLARADRQQIAALEAHFTDDAALRARQQAQDRQAGHGLAAPRFAHDAQPFAGLELKGDVACRLDLARTDAEEDAKPTHVQQRRSVCRYQQSPFVSSLFFLEQTLAARLRWSCQAECKRVNFPVLPGS